MRDLDTMLTSFCKNALHEARNILTLANRDLVFSVKAYIDMQRGAWAPLNEDYLNWKDRNGLDTRILIATGGYRNSIIMTPVRDRLGRFTSFSKMTASQIPDLRMGVTPGLGRSKKDDDGSPDSDAPTYRQIGQWLEFGTSNMPARPHFGPAVFLFKTRHIPRINDQLSRLILKGSNKKYRTTPQPRTKIKTSRPAKPSRPRKAGRPYRNPNASD